jgi:hypothetical protein
MIVQRSNGAKGGRRWKECKSKSSSLNGNPRSSKSSNSCKPGEYFESRENKVGYEDI